MAISTLVVHTPPEKNGKVTVLKSLHPVLRLFTAQPQLALDHVGYYFDWLDSEVTRVSAQWRLRLILLALAIALAGAAFVGTLSLYRR